MVGAHECADAANTFSGAHLCDWVRTKVCSANIVPQHAKPDAKQKKC